MYAAIWFITSFAVARLFGTTVSLMDKGERRIVER